MLVQQGPANHDWKGKGSASRLKNSSPLLHLRPAHDAAARVPTLPGCQVKPSGAPVVSTNTAPILFIHIPKPAGTSFRKGAESFFGSQHVVYDYGGAASATSSLARQMLYGEHEDFWCFARACEEA